MAQTIAQLASKLGLDTSNISPRTQEVHGVLIGSKPCLTKAGKPMKELYFLSPEGEVQTINMTENADRPLMVVGETYSARWFGIEFQVLPGIVEFGAVGDQVVVDETVAI